MCLPVSGQKTWSWSEDTLWRAARGIISSGLSHAITLLGALARVTIDCGFPLVAMVTRSAVEEFGLVSGVPVVSRDQGRSDPFGVEARRLEGGNRQCLGSGPG